MSHYYERIIMRTRMGLVEWLLRTRIGSICAFPITLYWNLYSQNLFGNFWYNKITSNIILGGYPTKNVVRELTLNKNLKGVVSVLSSHELFFTLNKEEWQHYGVDHFVIACYDFDCVPTEKDVKKGIEFINKIISDNIHNQVYIHCKAGKGRSALVLACYLIQKENISPNQAISIIKKYRPQINLGNNQLQFIEKFAEKVVNNKL